MLGIARTRSIWNEFRTSFKALLNKAQNQGGNAVDSKRIIAKYFCRNFESFEKFSDYLLHS